MSTAEKKPLSAAGRKRLKAERESRSVVWRVIYWLGSLQLALLLLATIAIACAIATFAESGFSAKIAQAYIYKAPWFIVWLGVLCINLIAVTITRWPWERRHAGFIVTHYGIVILLAGAVVGLQTGFEGNVTLVKGAPPTTRVVTNRSIIQVESPADSYLYLQPFDAELARLSPNRPRIFPVPGTDLRIVAEEYAPSLVKTPTLLNVAENGLPAAILEFTSPVTEQVTRMALSLSGDTDKQDFFGLAEVEMLPDLPPPPPLPATETRMVFARYAPVSNEQGAAETLIQVSEDGERISITDSSGTGATYRLADLIGKSITEAGSKVTLEKYWPDFAMEDGEPVSRSGVPRNPAALFRIQPLPEEDRSGPVFQLAPDDHAASVSFRLSRGGLPYAEGDLTVGSEIQLGWADWRARLVEFSPSAQIVEQYAPAPPPPSAENPTPGFRARLSGPDGDGTAVWVPSGEVTPLSNGSRVVRLGYGLETRPLPFQIDLVSFDVPRDEGTDRPADFRATVEFTDRRTGESKRGVARMNSPASYPGTLWANLTGINYKFSQAEWNPRNLDQTTLQVLYDPGWLLKWIGSLCICIGIFMQFYLKPKARREEGVLPANTAG